MKTHLRENPIQKTDEAWIVVDKDQWSEEQLNELHKWAATASKNKKYGLALSNPKFELWLLLHFEDAKGVATPESCSQKLKAYIPNYNKSLPPNKITPAGIEAAVKRAKQKDSPPCKDWPRSTGTTVYRLVENIING